MSETHKPFFGWLRLCSTVCIWAAFLARCTTYNTPGDLALVSLEAVDEYDQAEIMRLPPEALLLSQLGASIEVLRGKGVLKDFKRHHRLLLKATFTTAADLNKLALESGSTLDVDGFFCDRRSDRVFLTLPSIYWRGIRLPSPRAAPEEDRDGEKRVTYYFYFGVVREEVKPSRPQIKGYDLLRTPEYVCANIELDDNTGFGKRSNTIEIPKEAISAALKRLPPNFASSGNEP